MDIAPQPALDPLTRAEMERTYVQLLSTVVQMARLLGKPCPVVTRAERRDRAAMERQERS